MKRVLQLLSLAGAAAGAAWFARRRAASEPAPAEGTWSGKPKLTAVPDVGPGGEQPVEKDLTAIRGIGPVYAGQLAELGITTLEQLAAAEPEKLAESLDARADIADWVSQAKSLTA